MDYSKFYDFVNDYMNENINSNNNNTSNTSNNSTFTSGTQDFACGQDIPNGFQGANPQLVLLVGEILGNVMSQSLPFNLQNFIGNWLQLVGQIIETYNSQQQYMQAGPGRYYDIRNININNPFCQDNNPSTTGATDDKGGVVRRDGDGSDYDTSYETFSNNTELKEYISGLKEYISGLKEEIENLKTEIEKLKSERK